MISITEDERRIINEILHKNLSGGDYEVRAFGSRVNGQPKKYSDLDLVIVGKEKISREILSAIEDDFEWSQLSFRVDVLDWQRISKEFQQIIEKNYEVFE